MVDEWVGGMRMGEVRMGGWVGRERMGERRDGWKKDEGWKK